MSDCGGSGCGGSENATGCRGHGERFPPRQNPVVAGGGRDAQNRGGRNGWKGAAAVPLLVSLGVASVSALPPVTARRCGCAEKQAVVLGRGARRSGGCAGNACETAGGSGWRGVLGVRLANGGRCARKGDGCVGIACERGGESGWRGVPAASVLHREREGAGGAGGLVAFGRE